MLKKPNKQESEKQAMTSKEIRAMREEELLDSIYKEKTDSELRRETAGIWAVTVISAAVLIVALHYFGRLNSYLCTLVLPYLWMIDNGSGFLGELFAALIDLALVLFITVSFSFALNINYSTKSRPKDRWRKMVRWCILAAFGFDVVYLAVARLLGSKFALPGGGFFSKVMYFVTKLLVVPFADVMLYLVVPSAVIGIILTLVSETREKMEIPLTAASSVILILGMLDLSWSGVRAAGFAVALYAVVQGVAYSIVYHRTDTIWRPVMLYSSVTAVYYALSWLLSLI